MNKRLFKNRLLMLLLVIFFYVLYNNKFVFDADIKLGIDNVSPDDISAQTDGKVSSTLRRLPHKVSGGLERIGAGKTRPNVRTRRRTIVPRCKTKQNVAFLKTHKTGGSTITNILNRFGDSRNLTFVLPKIGEFRLNWPYNLGFNSFMPLHGKEPNILSNHARYDRDILEQIMPIDTAYVTILRDPADQFDSAFRFFKLSDILGVESDEPLRTFLDKPWMFLERKLSHNMTALEFQRVQLSRNGMLFDLGFGPETADITELVNSYITQIDRDFSLVMLMEYFDESVILLKRLLCWSLEDILYFPMNKRVVPDRKSTSEELRDQIRTWNLADSLLYEYFNKTFWRKIQEQGSDFYQEIQLFRNKLKQMRTVCLGSSLSFASDTATVSYRTAAVFVERYSLRKDINNGKLKILCEKMLTNEVAYVKYLQEKHIVITKGKSKYEFVNRQKSRSDSRPLDGKDLILL